MSDTAAFWFLVALDAFFVGALRSRFDRLLCRLVGHRRGHDLFRYRYECAPNRKQYPGRLYSFVVVGFECVRCGVRVMT